MRDLSTEEMFHVYGAGGRGKSPCPPTKRPRCGGKGGKGSSGGYSGRCGKGSSS